MPTSDSPEEYSAWVDRLEQDWVSGLVPDPKTVAIILTNSHQEVLLQLRDNDPRISFPNTWTLPGGVVEPGETPDQAACRELLEEAGIEEELSLWKVYRWKPEERSFFIEQYVYSGTTRHIAEAMVLGEGQALRFFRQDQLVDLSIAFEFGDQLEEYFSANMGAG